MILWETECGRQRVAKTSELICVGYEAPIYQGKFQIVGLAGCGFQKVSPGTGCQVKVKPCFREFVDRAGWQANHKAINQSTKSGGNQ